MYIVFNKFHLCVQLHYNLKYQFISLLLLAAAQNGALSKRNSGCDRAKHQRSDCKTRQEREIHNRGSR